MQPQLEVIRQDIQDDTSNYLVNIPTPNTNILDTDYETINYIGSFFKYHYYYPIFPVTSISQIYYPYSQEHLKTDLRA